MIFNLFSISLYFLRGPTQVVHSDTIKHGIILLTRTREPAQKFTCQFKACASSVGSDGNKFLFKSVFLVYFAKMYETIALDSFKRRGPSLIVGTVPVFLFEQRIRRLESGMMHFGLSEQIYDNTFGVQLHVPIFFRQSFWRETCEFHGKTCFCCRPTHLCYPTCWRSWKNAN
jgi:hypothetical protein